MEKRQRRQLHFRNARIYSELSETISHESVSAAVASDFAANSINGGVANTGNS